MKRNPSQLRAITHLSGPMMVLAGPGSGKTSVIVERTAYMINEGKIPASSILVVTFSRAAATEMKERFLKFVGQNRSEVTFGTFHGIFYGILKAAYHLSAANILSEEEKFSILREMTEKYGQEMAQEGDFIEEVAKEISVVKGNCISPEHYYASCCSDEIFRDIFHGYKQALKAKRKLDFDDMILCCYELFSQRQDILNAWRRKFVYILVDEFQDINSLQYKILQMLAAPVNNLFIVGDDDQSIYHFRGARPEIMLNFTKDYPKAETVLLNVNYRCSKNILRTAMKVIGCNTRRFKKQLDTPNEEGMPVTCKEFDNPREEYMCVVAALKKRMERGEDLLNTAILLRTNQESEGLINVLMEYQVPFTMKEQLPNLFRHWICRALLAYLEMAAGDRSRKNFLEIMELRVQPLMPLGRGNKNLENICPTDIQYRKLVNTINTINARNPSIKIVWGDPVDHLIRFPEHTELPMYYISIRANGDIVTSPYLPLVVGNIRNHSIEEYWNGGLYELWKKKIPCYMAAFIKSVGDMGRITEKFPATFMDDIYIDMLEKDLDDLSLLPNN